MNACINQSTGSSKNSSIALGSTGVYPSSRKVSVTHSKRISKIKRFKKCAKILVQNNGVGLELNEYQTKGKGKEFKLVPKSNKEIKELSNTGIVLKGFKVLDKKVRSGFIGIDSNGNQILESVFLSDKVIQQ